MQFTLVVTATKTRKNRRGGFRQTDPQEIEKCFSCRLFWETELWVEYYILISQNSIDSFSYLCLLGSINNNSPARWSFSLSTSWFDNSL